jgi:hypothetical protein
MYSMFYIVMLFYIDIIDGISWRDAPHIFTFYTVMGDISSTFSAAVLFPLTTGTASRPSYTSAYSPSTC